MFCYNRPDHTVKTVEALKKNLLADQSDLIIYSDAPKNEVAIKGVEEVRLYLKSITGFKSVKVIERDRNWGLAPSIIDGVTDIVNRFGNVIVLEDDLVTNPYFLEYMNAGIEKYKDDPKVASIHGFIYDIPDLPETFFIRGADCWGWATWKRAWDQFNPNGEELLSELQTKRLTRLFDFQGEYAYVQMLKDQIAGRNSSWAIRWYASAFLKEMLTLYPGKSLVKNIGFDMGTHCNDGEDNPAFGKLSDAHVRVRTIPVIHDNISYLKMVKFFKSQKKSLFARAFNKLKRILKRN